MVAWYLPAFSLIGWLIACAIHGDLKDEVRVIIFALAVLTAQFIASIYE